MTMVMRGHVLISVLEHHRKVVAVGRGGGFSHRKSRLFGLSNFLSRRAYAKEIETRVHSLS